MPSWVSCENNHSSGLKIRDAAIALAETGKVGRCKRRGDDLQMFTQHTYANEHRDGKRAKPVDFRVVAVVRLGTRCSPQDDEEYDPFLYALLHSKTKKIEILPQFWADAPGRPMKYGQFSPILSMKEWRTLFKKMDARLGKIRVFPSKDCG